MHLPDHLRRVALTSALIGTLAVTGCADTQPASEATTRGPQPSVSQTPSKTPPTSKPKPMTDKESAKAFVREWADESIQMITTGETEAFASMTSECVPCGTTVQRVEKAYAFGGYVTAEPWIINSIKAQPHQGGFRVDINVTMPPAREFDRDGNRKKTYPGENSDLRVDVVKRRGRWSIRALAKYV